MLNKNMEQALKAFQSEGIVREFNHGQSDVIGDVPYNSNVYTVSITWGVNQNESNRNSYSKSLRKAGFSLAETFGNREIWEYRA